MYQLQSLIDQLPEVNRETLKRLIGHLLKYVHVLLISIFHSNNPILIPHTPCLMFHIPFHRVIQHEADNKMSQSNIISLFGPTLMTVDGDAVSPTH